MGQVTQRQLQAGHGILQLPRFIDAVRQDMI
jgi:hypothetical protein